MKNIVFKGVAICKGIAIGKPLFLEDEILYAKKNLNHEEIESEIKRYKRAVKKSQIDLEHLQKRFLKDGVSVVVDILDAHLELLHDPLITQLVEEKIKSQKKNTESIFSDVIREYDKNFQEDDFFQERVKDIKDVSRRVLKNLYPHKQEERKNSYKDTIVIAKDLIPSDALEDGFKDVCGFITEKGGYSSHTAIIARAKHIPYIAKIDIEEIKKIDIDLIVIDSIKGEIHINPTNDQLEYFREKQKLFLSYFEKIKKKVHLDAKTKDGIKIDVLANIESLNDIEIAKKNCATGVGLFRSEYLFLTQKDYPTEENQFLIYKELLQSMGKAPVTIRLFDIGADKSHLFIEGARTTFRIDDEKLKKTPSLGSRGIRFLIKNKNLLEDQLKALLRASVYGNLKILIPLVSDLNELLFIKDEIKRLRDLLTQAGNEVKKDIPLGCMIEVPSAAIMSDLLAKEADFFSIGTNDLTQYVTASNRANPDTSHLYDYSHPSLLRFIKISAEAAIKNGIGLSLCGEMAADIKFTPLLIGMGIKEFSLSPNHIPSLKHAIRNIDTKEAIEVAKRALSYTTSSDLKSFFKSQRSFFLTKSEKEC